MSAKNTKSSGNPIVQMLKNLLNKFMQAPDVYPIKYYKKGKRFHSF